MDSNEPLRHGTVRSPAVCPAGRLGEDARGVGLGQLHRRIREVRTGGGRVPCVESPEGGGTADGAKERARAAWRCLDCVAFLACANYVAEFPETGGVWAGQGFQPHVAPVHYLDRREPQPNTYDEYSPPDSMGIRTRPHSGSRSNKEIKMTKPTTGTCLCGCDEPTARNYKPGHDARHVSQLIRAVAEGLDKRVALKALPTEPLRAKLTRSLAKRPAKATAVTE